MAVTHKLIQTITVGSGGAASIDFTSIPQTYTDLVVLVSSRSAHATTQSYILMSFNGVTTNRNFRYITGDGSAASSSTGTDTYIGNTPGSSATASVFANTAIYLPNYSGSTNKSYSVDTVAENNATTANQFFLGGLWSSTSAITSLSFSSGGNFVQYSSASLYGILKS